MPIVSNSSPPFSSQGLPKGAVQNAMQRDELDPSIMDLDPTKSAFSQMKKEEKVNDGPPLKDDPKYSKYFKMLKMVSYRCGTHLVVRYIYIIVLMHLAYFSFRDCQWGLSRTP